MHGEGLLAFDLCALMKRKLIDKCFDGIVLSKQYPVRRLSLHLYFVVWSETILQKEHAYKEFTSAVCSLLRALGPKLLQELRLVLNAKERQ